MDLMKRHLKQLCNQRKLTLEGRLSTFRVRQKSRQTIGNPLILRALEECTMAKIRRLMVDLVKIKHTTTQVACLKARPWSLLFKTINSFLTKLVANQTKVPRQVL